VSALATVLARVAERTLHFVVGGVEGAAGAAEGVGTVFEDVPPLVAAVAHGLGGFDVILGGKVAASFTVLGQIRIWNAGLDTEVSSSLSESSVRTWGGREGGRGGGGMLSRSISKVNFVDARSVRG
jgi:hypothetical protein